MLEPRTLRRMMVFATLLFILGNNPVSLKAGAYSESAHGDQTNGVTRDGFSKYSIGNCAHCHEQHASIGGSEPAPVDGEASGSALFTSTFNESVTVAPYVQSDLFCFYCHTDLVETYQANAGAEMYNYDYSRTFGGFPGGPDDILEAFNQPTHPTTRSNHNLLGLQEYAANNFPDWFGEDSDPCTACHNPHIAKRNKMNLRDSAYSTISLPSDHGNHWGDEPDEQMSDYASNYRAPYYYNSISTYEPDAATSYNGDLIPDYNTFCLECHGPSAGSVTSRNHSRQLKAIDWSAGGGDSISAGDKHGVNIRTGDVDTRGPYNGVSDLVLACCDCHEPHGSPYSTLVRRSINGEEVEPIGIEDGDRGHQCRQCHKDDYILAEANSEINSWKGVHHGGGAIADNPYKTNQSPSCGCHKIDGTKKLKIPCEDCHGHGKFVSGTVGTQVYVGTADERTCPAPFDGVGRKAF